MANAVNKKRNVEWEQGGNGEWEYGGSGSGSSSGREKAAAVTALG
jgi:hypothetical protein